MAQRTDFYDRKDPRFVPMYSLREAAQCLGLPVTTLRVWALGQAYPTTHERRRAQPMFELADPVSRSLSFVNLIEAHVLRGLRTKHELTMQHIKRALRQLTNHEAPAHPLAFEDFLTDGVDLFIDHLGRIINLNRAGQIALEETLRAHLQRVERGPGGPVRFFPFVRGEDVLGPRNVSLAPTVAFGRPVVAGTRVTTAEIAGRVNAGETLEHVAEDLGLDTQQAKDAILFEQRIEAA